MSIAWRKRRLWIGLALLLLATLYFVRPGADRLKASITTELSRAMWRPVTAGSVSLRFLPQPGFDIEDFSVAEDPAFGNEPLLRSRHVSANLRLSTLWRRRLDISSLHLTEPSLNLVFDHGRWNTESILNRAANTPVTPTAETPTAEKPPFPYINATEGRINFKVGAEKKPWVLTEADFSISLTSDDAWYLGLEARPLRTDQALSDTGTVKASLTLKRGPSLAESPLAGEVRWQDGQLGQVSRLISGTDPGWRGGTLFDVTLNGRAADLQLAATGSLSGFHRYDIEASGAPTLSPKCSARYSVLTDKLSEASCTMELGGSSVIAKGELTGLFAPSEYSVAVKAEKVWANTLLAFAKVSKQGLPRDLSADGTVDFSLVAEQTSGGAPSHALASSAMGLVLRSSELKPELTLGDVTLLTSVSDGKPIHGVKRVKATKHSLSTSAVVPKDAITIGPIKIANAKAAPLAPLEISGWWNKAGYTLHATGDAQMQRALQLAHTAGLTVPATTADGGLHLDATITGTAAGFAAPTLSGTAQLHTVLTELSGLSMPLQLETATVTFLPTSFRLEKLTAKLGPTNWSGSAERALTCNQSEPCLYHLDLHTEKISAADLQELLAPTSPKRPWYRGMGVRSAPPTDLAQLHADGTITAARIEPAEPHTAMRLTGFTSKFRVNQGALELSEGKLKAGNSIYALEGTIGGKGEMDLHLTRGREQFHVVGSTLKPKLESAADAASVSTPTASNPKKSSR